MYNVYTTSLVSYAEVQNVTPYHLLRFLDIVAKHVVHATIDKNTNDCSSQTHL